MVDGVYQDIAAALKPGVKESQIVALGSHRLYEMGSDCVEAINAIAGERCSPHPHNFTDRLIRPGDQAYFDIIHSFMGYRTCYYRTFSVGHASAAQRDAYQRARQWMDGAISMLKPGVSTDKVAKMFPKSTEIGFETEMAAFGLNFCHGLGRMGYEMAAHLAKGGADVLAWNRTRAKAEPLAKHGAKVAGHLSEIAERDIVFCMVSTWDDLKEVMTGLLHGAKRVPQIVVE